MVPLVAPVVLVVLVEPEQLALEEAVADEAALAVLAEEHEDAEGEMEEAVAACCRLLCRPTYSMVKLTKG